MAASQGDKILILLVSLFFFFKMGMPIKRRKPMTESHDERYVHKVALRRMKHHLNPEDFKK